MPVTLEQMTTLKRITISGRDYSIHRMKPLTVIAVARRLAPLLGILKGMRNGTAATAEAGQPVMEGAKTVAALPEASFENAIERFGPVLEGLARLPEADVNYVIGACLCCVQAQGSAFPRVWSAEHDSLSDASLSPGDVMSLVGQVLFKVFEELMADLPDIGLMGAKAA